MNCTSDNIAFSNLNNNEFFLSVKKGIISNDASQVDFVPSDFQQKVFDELNSAINNNAFDFDAGEGEDGTSIPTVNCKYYSVNEFVTSKFNPSKNFSILHYNIHSIQLHIEELRVALQLLNFNFDIICISESKILANFDPYVDISIPGYQTPVSVPTEATKGGVLIYVKNGIRFKPRDDLNIYKSKELESVFIETFNDKDSNDIIGVIYRHPSMNESEFVDDYLKIITDKLSNVNKNIFIAGDFNFNLLNAAEHDHTFNFFDTMMSNFLLPTITLPTKINRGHNSLIDNIFTSHLHPDSISGNIELNLSDGHLPSFLLIPRKNQNHLPKKHNIFSRSTKNFDNGSFLRDYHNIDWIDVINITNNDVNYSINTFLEKFNAVLDNHMPLRKITHREFKQKFKPWISGQILSKIDAKNKALRKYIRSKNLAAKNDLYRQFKDLKNEVTQLLRSSKKDFYQKYFTENKDNIKKMWKGIKEIINIKAKNFDYPTCLQNGDTIITDPISVSNSFNDYFTSIADNILAQRKYDGRKSHRDFLANRLTENFIFEDTDEKEISSIISSLHVSKSSGPNSIPTFILHLLKDHICLPLAHIFNLSLRTGCHPDILKISKTIPVFKKGSRLLVSNYRPISLLSNLNKILEKVVHSRVYQFLEDYQCIYSLQFGFRKKHSTNHALIQITETIRQALDDKKFACGIFVDLQKAFDTVNHNILIDKLDHYGIRGTANKWFSSYLNNRSQFVSILGFDSSVKNVPHGVPQGSVLGPLLFLIYINDLYSAIKHSKVFHFADDTNLLNISDTPKKMQKNVNSDLKILYNWLLANKISLNCDKTEIIFFHKPGERALNIKIKMNGHRLFPSPYIKYLGMHLDETLNGSFHVQNLSKKLKRANGMLSKARHYVLKEDLRTLYFAIFSSHLIYASQIWGQVTNSHNQKIFKLQNRSVRIISFSDFRASVNPIYSSLNILKLRDQIVLQNCLFVHDSLNNIAPSCFSAYFRHTRNAHSLNTRQATLGCLYPSSYSTFRYGIFSITNRCISHWNALCKSLNTDLLTLTRHHLKIAVSKHLKGSY